MTYYADTLFAVFTMKLVFIAISSRIWSCCIWGWHGNCNGWQNVTAIMILEEVKFVKGRVTDFSVTAKGRNSDLKNQCKSQTRNDNKNQQNRSERLTVQF